MKILLLTFLFILPLAIASNSVFGQGAENTFTEPKFRLSMKYPSEWSFISSPGDPSADNGHLYFAGFCPSSYLESDPNVLSCQSESPVNLGINLYKLEDGTTLKQFYEQQITLTEAAERLVGARKNIETNRTKISGLSAIQTISTNDGGSGSLGKLLAEAGVETPISRNVNVYLVNGSTGYTIIGGTDDEEDFETYLPTLEKMINSFQIEAAQENQKNAGFVPETDPAPTNDVVLLSHRLKEGDGDYNDVIGQVKNIGSDTVEFVKLGLTVYDKNGDVVGTDSIYADASTLDPNQKSSFDIFSNKDNFDGMETYELSLQWRGSDGTDEYVDNAQIYKEN